MLLNNNQLSSVLRFFNFVKPSTEVRSAKAKKNIALLLFFNAFNFIFVLLTVPITLKYLGPEDYGIWVTISSFLLWLNFFDFGLGNGLRNKLAECLALDKKYEAKIYVSTAYFLFTIILTIFWLLFFIPNFFINWSGILNISAARNKEMQILIIILFAMFNVQFILKLITSILHADQNTAINGMLSFLINLFSLVVTYILYLVLKSSLSYLAYANSLVPILVFLIASFFLFTKKYKDISPSLKNIKLSFSKGLFGLGISFFVLQIAGLIVFSSQNIVIAQLFGPADVTTYNIAYRYFFFVAMFFNIILTPLWSAYTEAYIKKDFNWISKTMKQVMNIWVILSIITLIMLIGSTFIYRIWVGKSIDIPFNLSILMAIYITINNWNNIFAYFLNGVGKIRIELILASIGGLISIPLSIIFAKYLNMGLPGIILAASVCLLPGSIITPIQYIKLINKKADGIWNK